MEAEEPRKVAGGICRAMVFCDPVGDGAKVELLPEQK